MPSSTRIPLIVMIGCAILAAVLAGCAKKAEPPAPATGAGASPSQTHPGSTLAIAGQFVGDADQATIRAYLQSVKELKPKKFEVTWSADTVPVSRDEALRSLQAVSRDGSEYTFASSEPVVSKLKPGRILWIWGITIRRIDRVGIFEDATVVHTRPVALTEALTDADIEFESPINFGDAYGSYRPHPPRTKPAAKTSSLRRTPRFRLAALTQPSDPQPADAGQSDASDVATDDQEDIVAGTTDAFHGKVAGFEYALGYRVSGEQLNVKFEARKEEEGNNDAVNNEVKDDQRAEFFEAVKEQNEARKEALHTFREYTLMKQALDDAAANGYPPSTAIAKMSATDQETIAALKRVDMLQVLPQLLHEYKEEKEKEHAAEVKAKALAAAGALMKQLFSIVSDNLDVRFKADMQLNSAGVAGAMKIASGKMQTAGVHFSDLKGRLDLEFVGRMGQPGNGAVNIPVAHVPLMMNVPLPVYGIPFVFQLGGDFLVKLFLSGNHAAHHFVGHYTFGGTAGFHATPTKTESDSTLTESEPEVEPESAMSPGTSGTVLGIQLPRLGLGLGLFGAGAMSFVDVVSVMTITNSAAVAALNPQCRHVTLDVTPHVGVEVSIMPIPIPLVETVANSALSQKVALTTKHWERTTPDLKMCHI